MDTDSKLKFYKAEDKLKRAAEWATEGYVSYLSRGEGPRSFIPSMDSLIEAVKEFKAVEKELEDESESASGT